MSRAVERLIALADEISNPLESWHAVPGWLHRVRAELALGGPLLASWLTSFDSTCDFVSLPEPSLAEVWDVESYEIHFREAVAIVRGAAHFVAGVEEGDYQNQLNALFAQLHPTVVSASGRLFASGHYSQAVFEATKALEIRVKEQAELPHEIGVRLMTSAFAGEPGAARINLSHERGASGKNEQDGFGKIFVGVMQGLRNPKGHAIVQQEDPQRGFEYLSMISVLFRRLDDATTRSSIRS